MTEPTANEPPFSPANLHAAELDQPTIEQLFRDLAEYTEVLDITAKQRTGAYADAQKLSLADARDILLSRSARGVQIRYRWEGDEWWDTILVTPSAWRIVRVKQQFH